MVDNKRPFIAFSLFVCSVFSLCATVSPRLCYAVTSEWWRVILDPYQLPIVLTRIDAVLSLAALSTAPLLGYLSWRAASPIAARVGHEWAALLPLLLMITAPAWLAPLVSAFGAPAAIFGIVAWFVAALSVLGYVGAAAARQTEIEGGRPLVAPLDAIYHVGGAPGVYAARATWPESETIAKLAKEPPYAFGFLLSAAIVMLAIKLTN